MTLSVGLIILLRVLFPDYLAYQSYKVDVLDNLFENDAALNYVLRATALLVLESFEYLLLSLRVKRVYKNFRGFRETRITPLSYVQIAVTPASAWAILHLLFPCLWL